VSRSRQGRLDVLYVYGDFGVGGLEIDVRNLANGLVARGYRAGLATAAPAPNAPICINGLAHTVEVQPLIAHGGTFGRRLGFASGITRVIRNGHWHIIHVFSSLPSYVHFAAMAAGRVAGRAVVWTPMLHPNRASMWNRGVVGYGIRSFDAVVPQAARFVDAIVAATDEEAYRFRRLGCRLVEVIPPAVDEAPLLGQHDASIFRRRYGLGRGPIVLIVAARNEKRKGLGFAIEAFRELKNQVLDARLAIVGLPRHELPAGVGDVHFLGRIPVHDLARAYRAADVVFVPSRYEAFSRVVIEAWQQATPVVVTNGVGLATTVAKTQRTGSGAIPSALTRSVVSYGDVRQAADALGDLLVRPTPAVRAGAAGRKLVEKAFTVTKVVDSTCALYQEVVGG